MAAPQRRRRITGFGTEYGEIPYADAGGPSGSISTTFTLSTTVTGAVVVAKTGAIDTTFTLSTDVTGVGTTPGTGAIDTTFTLSTTVDGTPTKKGAVDTTFTLSTTVDGTPTKKGAVDTTFTLSTSVDGSRVASGAIDTTFTFSTTVDGAIPPLTGAIDTTFTFSAPIEQTAQLGLFSTTTTLFPPRIGVTVDATAASASHTVISGVTSRTAGAAAILAGDYAFRGLYSIESLLGVPGDFQNDARDWVVLASWGDFQLRLRRDITSTYRIRADWVTDAAEPVSVQSQLAIFNDEQRSLGLGVTRDATTGAMTLWLSEDGWVSWSAMPTTTQTVATGALPDSAGDAITVLSGDLQDGQWISVFQAQWGATTDITDVDTNEVAAWNYGTNIVTGVGGDFYDEFDRAAKNTWEFGSETSFVYSQRSETTDAGTTLRADFTFNAPTLNTGTPTAGTEAAFSYDTTPQWQDGPAANSWSQAMLFESRSQFFTNPDLDSLTFPTSPGGGLGSAGGGAAPAGSPPPTPPRTDDGGGQRYRVIIVNQAGEPQSVIETAQVGAITWSLNEIESFSFTAPVLDPAIAGITVADTEVQIWRGNKMVIWGVIVRVLANDQVVDFQCRGLAWYFTKRFVGGPKTEYLVNGSFETTGGWFHEQFAPTEEVRPPPASTWAWRISSEKSIKGYPGRSLYQYSTDGNEFGIASSQFLFNEITVADRPDGIKWTASAWIYIPADEWGFYDDEAEKIVGERNTAYNWGGESAAFGLHLGRFSTTESQEQDLVTESYPKVEEFAVASITEDLPRDEWVRIEVSLHAPAPEAGQVSRTDWMQVELHTPLGGVYWDEVSLTIDERLYYDDVPQETILFDLVNHAQDTTLGKSDLNISFLASPFTSITRDRRYDYYNRQIILDLIDEFSTIWNGVDWSIYTNATQRLFAAYWPMKGTRRPAQALVLGRNIAKITPAYDGESIANRVVIQSDAGGTGSSREEAIGTNTEGFKDGIVLEASFNATKDSPLDSIEGQVERALRQKRDGTIPTLTTYEGVGATLFGRIETGDIVPVEASYGGIEVSGSHRIVAITLNPDDETMDIVVNPFDDYRDPVYAQATRIGF